MPLLHPLNERFNTLPLIICGPIVRRVEPEIVSVWVALKAERKIELELYTGYCSPSGPGFPEKTVALKSAKTSTTKIGEHLHVALITIESAGLFTHGGIFSYDLLFYENTDSFESLISLGLLDEPELIGFKKGQLPSFIVAPEKMEDLRIAHGSCRKPHGRGRDGIAVLARIMEPDFIDPDRILQPKIRPHCFFHTGDQIYADDCTDFLIQHYTDAGNFLLQKVEEMPFPKNPENNYSKQGQNDADFVWMQITSEALPPGRRATNFYSGFTGSQSNHLYSFAEFAAAYLFQWCDVLWPEELPETEEIYFDRLNDNSQTRTYLFPVIKKGDVDKDGNPLQPQVPANWDSLSAAQRRTTLATDEDAKKGLENFKQSRQKKQAIDAPHEKELVQDFRKDLKAVRRVLANTPSIMSFDDHDITDDWYLNGGWSKQALGTRLGEAIIRNGLLAFAVFQGWGNDPKGWADESAGKNDRNTLLKDIPALISSFKPLGNSNPLVSNSRPPGDKEFTDKFHASLGFANFENPPVKWHCFLKLSQARVFVLDTRTRRDFSPGLHFPPNLLGKKALEEQIPDNAMPFGTELAIVISGAPVLGLTAIEAIGQPIIPRILDVIHLVTEAEEKYNITKRLGVHKGRDSLDVEHWSLNTPGFEAMLKRCATLKKVLFLAGDVHYGFTSEMDYFIKGETEAARFVQMVSSSLKNIKPQGELMGILPSGIAQTALSGGLNREFLNLTSIGWEKPEDIEKVSLSIQTAPNVFAEAKSLHIPLRIKYAMSKKPVFISLRDWPLKAFESETPEQPPQILNRIVFKKSSPEPSFRWMMNVLRDTRPDNLRFKAMVSKPPDLDTDIVSAENSGAAYETGLDRIMRRGAFFSRSHINRTVTWFSHIAMIDFEKKDNDELITKQSMFFYPFLEIPDDDQPGNYEEPFLLEEASLNRKPASGKPDFPLEP